MSIEILLAGGAVVAAELVRKTLQGILGAAERVERIRAWHEQYETRLGELQEKVEVVNRQEGLDVPQYWADAFRDLWLQIPFDHAERRTALAVVHGLVERADGPTLTRAREWLREVYRRFLAEEPVQGSELERLARALHAGLPVLDQERDPLVTTGTFGVVQEVEDGKARISFSIPESENDPTAPILEAYTVPVVDLPLWYGRPGTWVAWVERSYEYGGASLTKGRFEPAGVVLGTEAAVSKIIDIEMGELVGA